MDQEKKYVKTVIGVLDAWYETGTEGVIWSVHEDGKKGYEGLNCIDEDDFLTIYNPDGSVAFTGEIKEDHETGWEKFPHNPQFGQQTALGYWVHWIQQGWQPDAWARLFFHDPPLRAELKKAPFRERDIAE